MQESAIGAGPDNFVETPRTRFAVPGWRRAMTDDGGTGFAVVGDGERYILRVSLSGLAVAYVQHWPTLMRRADSADASGTGWGGIFRG